MKTKKMYKSMKQMLLFTFTLGLLSLNSTAANVAAKINLTEIDFEVITYNPILEEIIGILNSRVWMEVNLTSTTVRAEKSGFNYSYTAHGQKRVAIEGKNKIKALNDVRVKFSDRASNGKTDIQALSISSSGNSMQVSLTLKSWGDTKVNLTDVKIKKERFGYFVTGKSSDARSTTYYTMAIYQISTLE